MADPEYVNVGFIAHEQRLPNMVVMPDRDVAGFFQDRLKEDIGTGNRMVIYRESGGQLLYRDNSSDLKKGDRCLLYGRLSSGGLVKGLHYAPYIDADGIIKPLREVISPSIAYDRESNLITLWFWTNFNPEDWSLTDGYDEDHLITIKEEAYDIVGNYTGTDGDEPIVRQRVFCYTTGRFESLYITGGTSETGNDGYDFVPIFDKPQIINIDLGEDFGDGLSGVSRMTGKVSIIDFMANLPVAACVKAQTGITAGFTGPVKQCDVEGNVEDGSKQFLAYNFTQMDIQEDDIARAYRDHAGNFFIKRGGGGFKKGVDYWHVRKQETNGVLVSQTEYDRGDQMIVKMERPVGYNQPITYDATLITFQNQYPTVAAFTLNDSKYYIMGAQNALTGSYTDQCYYGQAIAGPGSPQPDFLGSSIRVHVDAITQPFINDNAAKLKYDDIVAPNTYFDIRPTLTEAGGLDIDYTYTRWYYKGTQYIITAGTLTLPSDKTDWFLYCKNTGAFQFGATREIDALGLAQFTTNATEILSFTNLSSTIRTPLSNYEWFNISWKSTRIARWKEMGFLQCRHSFGLQEVYGIVVYMVPSIMGASPPQWLIDQYGQGIKMYLPICKNFRFFFYANYRHDW